MYENKKFYDIISNLANEIGLLAKELGGVQDDMCDSQEETCYDDCFVGWGLLDTRDNSLYSDSDNSAFCVENRSSARLMRNKLNSEEGRGTYRAVKLYAENG